VTLLKRNLIFGLSALILTLLNPGAGSAKGGPITLDEPYSPEHVTSLPLEIRQIIVNECKEPRATREFFNYTDGTSEIVLHYEHLLCGISNVFCTAKVCLHQVYGRSAQGKYELIRSFYAAQPEAEQY
jgi:hypothetical protein